MSAEKLYPAQQQQEDGRGEGSKGIHLIIPYLGSTPPPSLLGCDANIDGWVLFGIGSSVCCCRRL